MFTRTRNMTVTDDPRKRLPQPAPPKPKQPPPREDKAKPYYQRDPLGRVTVKK